MALQANILNAVKTGNGVFVRKWLSNTSSNPNSVDAKGSTLLHWAVNSGHMDIIDSLLISGAKPNIQNSLGATPLHWAAKNNSLDIVNRLIMAGAKLDTLNSSKQTPVDVAKAANSIAVVEFFRQYLEDSELRDMDSRLMANEILNRTSAESPKAHSRAHSPAADERRNTVPVATALSDRPPSRAQSLSKGSTAPHTPEESARKTPPAATAQAHHMQPAATALHTHHTTPAADNLHTEDSKSKTKYGSRFLPDTQRQGDTANEIRTPSKVSEDLAMERAKQIQSLRMKRVDAEEQRDGLIAQEDYNKLKLDYELQGSILGEMKSTIQELTTQKLLLENKVAGLNPMRERVEALQKENVRLQVDSQQAALVKEEYKRMIENEQQRLGLEHQKMEQELQNEFRKDKLELQMIRDEIDMERQEIRKVNLELEKTVKLKELECGQLKTTNQDLQKQMLKQEIELQEMGQFKKEVVTLHGEISMLRVEANMSKVLQESMKNLQGQLNDKTNESKLQQQRIAEMEARISMLTNDANRFTKEISELTKIKDSVDGLTLERNSLAAKLKSAEDDMKQLINDSSTGKTKEMRSIIENLMNEKKAVSAELAERSASLKSLERNFVTLQTEMQHLQQSRAEFQNNSIKLQGVLVAKEELENELKEWNPRYQLLQDKLLLADKEVSQLSSELERMRPLIADYEDKKFEKQGLEIELEQSKLHTISQFNEIKHLKEQVDLWKGKAEYAVRLELELEKAKDALAKYSNEQIQKHTSNKVVYETHNKQLERQRELVEDRLRAVQQEASADKERIAKLEGEVTVMSKMFENTKELLESETRKRGDAEAKLTSSLHESNQSINRMKNDRLLIEAELKRLRKDRENFDHQRNTYADLAQRLGEERAGAAQMESELRNQMTQYQTERVELIKNRANAEKKLQLVVQERQALLAQVTSLQEQLSMVEFPNNVKLTALNSSGGARPANRTQTAPGIQHQLSQSHGSPPSLINNWRLPTAVDPQSRVMEAIINVPQRAPFAPGSMSY